jgi:hypothetical protein
MQIMAEVRRQQFLRFIHGGGDIYLAADLLVLLAVKGRTRAEVRMMAGQQSNHLLNFLGGQQLVYALRVRRAGDYAYKAIPHAIDELEYRLEHEGRPSPPPGNDDHRRSLARKRIEIALARSGWRGKAAKLRVV